MALLAGLTVLSLFALFVFYIFLGRDNHTLKYMDDAIKRELEKDSFRNEHRRRDS